MKKFLSITLLLTAMFLTFSACSKDDDEKEKVQDTTYTFSYTANDPPKGFTTNITLFEYNEKGEQIVQNHVNNCKKGRSEKFTANTDSRKIKVYLVVTMALNLYIIGYNRFTILKKKRI